MQHPTQTTDRRIDVSAAALDAAVTRVRDYDYGSRRTALIALEAVINATHGNREARLRLETAMAALLDSNATVAAKQFICKKLWIIGTDASVPALEKLLGGTNLALSEAACYALRSQPSPAAGRVLREGLGKVSGKALVAVINLIGDRRDPLSSARLAELTGDPDPMVVDAAIAALGKIASPEGVRTLSKLHSGPQGERRVLAAHALLQSGQELSRRGEIQNAKNVYQSLTGASEAPHIRRGASIALGQLA
jgi:HEAT repeat protein